MRHSIVLPTAIAISLLFGCNDSDDDAIDPVDDSNKTTQELLDENQTKWANANVSTYSYTYRVSCFCIPEEDIVVNVVNDEVASAFFVPSGTLLSADRLALQKTIDGLFGNIQTGIDEGYAKLEATYDSQFGFPVTIDEDPNLGIADDERFIQVGSFQ